MNQQPATHTFPGAAFWGSWVVLSAIATVIAALVFRPLGIIGSGSVVRALGPTAGEAFVGFVAGGGMLTLVGLAQAFALRGHVSWATRWAVASAVAGALGGAVMLGIGAGTRAGPIAGTVAGLVVLGVFHWRLLRAPAQWPGWTALTIPLALVTAGLSGGIVGGMGSLLDSNVAFGAWFGGVYGAVTGAVMLHLLRRPGTTTPPESVTVVA